MMHTVRTWAVVAALTAVAVSCPERGAITDFNIDAFLGVWYEVLRLPNTFERHYSCMADDYRHGESGITLHSHAYNTSTGVYDTLDAVVEIAPAAIGRFVIKTRNESAWNTTYWILGTDYTNYMVVFGCLQKDGMEPAASTWVLVRNLPLKEELLPNIDHVLADNSLSRDQFEAVSYQDCPPPPEEVQT